MSKGRFGNIGRLVGLGQGHKIRFFLTHIHKVISDAFIKYLQNETCESALEIVSGDTVFGNTNGTRQKALIGTALSELEVMLLPPLLL
jgi:hypothetical protein